MVYFNLFVYITTDFSFPLAIEMYGGHFFPGHPYIESTTVLSDIRIMVDTVTDTTFCGLQTVL